MLGDTRSSAGAVAGTRPAGSPVALLLPLACLLVAKYTIFGKMLEKRQNGHPATYQANIRIISDLYIYKSYRGGLIRQISDLLSKKYLKNIRQISKRYQKDIRRDIESAILKGAI